MPPPHHDPRSQIPLKDYLDSQFQHVLLSLADIKRDMIALSRQHDELTARVVRIEERQRTTDEQLRSAESFRRLVITLLVPVAFSVLGYLLVHLLNTLAR